MNETEANNPILPAKSGLIAVVPLGRVQEDVSLIVGDSLQGLLRLPVDVLDAVDLPEESFIPTRNQYNAMALMKYLDSHYADKCLKVLGVTSMDITNPILTYVFGEAYMDGRAAVMSTRRLGLDPKGDPIPREQFLERVFKVAIHEIGHTFNIPHCHTDRCVMKASNNLKELDDKLNYLCSYCELFLAESLTKALRGGQKGPSVRESVK